MIIEALRKLISGQNLEKEEMKSIMNEIMEGKLPESQISAFLVALRMKGETIDEITSAVEVLKEKAKKLYLDKNVIDIVGTGGDKSNTFNISTAAAFVVAAGGVGVAKHGNRSASSKSGAADILEVLGANIDLDCHQNKIMLEKTNLCFMFAVKYNPLIKNVLKVRREIKVRTIFNALGPLINPSNAKMQLIGVYDKNLVVPECMIKIWLFRLHMLWQIWE